MNADRGHSAPRKPHSTLSIILFGWTRRRWSAALILAALIAAGGALLAIEGNLERHPKFDIELRTAFYAAFGFLAFAALVLSGWLSGRLLKRPEAYYDKNEGQ